MLLSNPLPARMFPLLVLQTKFQEYLALSHSFLQASLERGSSDALPVVRILSMWFCVDYHSTTTGFGTVDLW